MEQIRDYITGKEIDIIGPEKSRQDFEKFLVEDRGYDRSEIRVDVPITVQFKGEDYPSSIDLIVSCKSRPFMAVTCVAGSIGSYEREILAGARLVYEFQVPMAVSTDGQDAVVMDTLTGKTLGQGLSAVPSRKEAETTLQNLEDKPLDKERTEREMIIYRSFNLEKINR
ncbi:type I restriction enzyme HsdR N-terminal domain-containing protein [Desulfospira joergensenii]|uniref:type I restriction enzyme HsdR N-terminal domain-containing protein n=1 Tax=Desulfospira joergensenii TaxID=53329 RepID=UPI0003B6C9BD|nr:type I restriction enzyme HsdR N-terminal domain-containing protein [Desulfospira joergensenii]